MSSHEDSSPVLTHFIRPEYLITLLRTQAFHLVRLDCQSDSADGKLPPANIAEPHLGTLERALGVTPEFLKNQAQAIEHGRNRTFIMSWTLDASPHMQQVYGEDGRRCALRTSMLELKILLGYEGNSEIEFPPKRRVVPEVPGAYASLQLIDASYSDQERAVPVVPSYLALGHKHQDFAPEAEIRVHAFLGPDSLTLDPGVRTISWALRRFQGLSILIGSKVEGPHANVIEQLAAEVGAAVARESG